jgi:hypothetical protein
MCHTLMIHLPGPLIFLANWHNVQAVILFSYHQSLGQMSHHPGPLMAHKHLFHHMTIFLPCIAVPCISLDSSLGVSYMHCIFFLFCGNKLFLKMSSLRLLMTTRLFCTVISFTDMSELFFYIFRTLMTRRF